MRRRVNGVDANDGEDDLDLLRSERWSKADGSPVFAETMSVEYTNLLPTSVCCVDLSCGRCNVRKALFSFVLRARLIVRGAGSCIGLLGSIEACL